MSDLREVAENCSEEREVIKLRPIDVLNTVLQRDVLAKFPLNELTKLFSADSAAFWLEDDEIDTNSIFLISSENRSAIENQAHQLRYPKKSSFISKYRQEFNSQYFILNRTHIEDLLSSIQGIPSDYDDFQNIFVLCLINEDGDIFGSVNLYFNRPIWLNCNADEMDETVRMLSRFVDAVKHERDSLLVERRKIGHEVGRKLRECRSALNSFEKSIRGLKVKISNRILSGVENLDSALDSAADTIDNEVFIEGVIKRSRRSKYINLLESMRKSINLSQNTHQKLDLRNSIAFSIPTGVNVKIDETDLDLVMSNLFENAVKYSSSGAKVIVRFKIVRGKGIVTVSNLSDALTDDECKYAWGYRFRGANSKNKDGDGVGLSIVSDICSCYKLEREFSQRSNDTHIWTDVSIAFGIGQYRNYN